jgi:aromatic ring-opening dioxygenase catalytic subunit (LigB family)
MAELVGIFAASHAPRVIREDVLTSTTHVRLRRAFKVIAQSMRALKPDVLVVIAPDHWVNFYLDNFPTITIGVGVQHGRPPEALMADFPHAELPGHAALGSFIVEKALRSGFEPSISHHLKLDHGICVPLWLLELEPLPATVPILFNAVQAPMMAFERCLDWGALLADAIAAFPQRLRVAVLATGGLSHWIGVPEMGQINDVFDQTCLEKFALGDSRQLISFLNDNIELAGNGAHEIRSWVMAHGSARNCKFELIDYLPVPEVYVGCGFASWCKPVQ